MNFNERIELFRGIVGSHNYNLNTETSDKDYKIFVLPTFDDLYFSKEFSKSYIGDFEDFNCCDIRKLSHLLWKSNINFIEVLFSCELTINQNLSIETINLLKNIFSYKEEIARMNLPYLYMACLGTSKDKKQTMEKGTSNTKYLVDKYGYDTKAAMTSIRMLDFLTRYANNNFSNFEKSIRYDKKDCTRDTLLAIKNGEFEKTKVLKFIDTMTKVLDKEYKEVYYKNKPNQYTNDKLVEDIKKIIKIEIFK